MGAVYQDKKKVFVSEHDSDDQFIFHSSIVEIDPQIEPCFFYGCDQLLRELRKMAAGRVFTNHMPLAIFGAFNPPLFAHTHISGIRSLKILDSIPLCVFIEKHSETCAESIRSAGADYVFTKPAHLAQFRKILKEVLQPQLRSGC